MEDYIDIGDYHKEVTTSSKNAQIWVNRGLINLFGFNHYAAIKCFKLAIIEDNECLFAYWGIAYSLGPHYNIMEITESNYKEGLSYLNTANEKVKNAKDWEIDMVNVLRFRYPNTTILEGEDLNKALKNFSIQMKKIYEKYEGDQDIAAIYSESLMNLRPWQLWTKDGKPYDEALIAREVLEKSLKNGYHPQLIHLYIHLLEQSPYYKETIPYADELYNNIKGIGHLFHMPSHIYIQLGDYSKCIESNTKASQAYHEIKKYLDDKITYMEFYRSHDIHFLIWAAMFIGDYDIAIKNSIYIKEIINYDVLLALGNIVEFYVSTEFHVLVRFGKWDEILNIPIETNIDIYPITIVIQRYARAIAYCVKGNIEESENELTYFKEIRVKANHLKYGNNSANDVFDVAESMIMGELLYRKKDYVNSFNYLRKSVKLSDSLIYDEPWDWMIPPRHALGALLLEQNYFIESEEVYLQDLKIYPNNIWSLTGLEEIYEKQGRELENRSIKKELLKARQNSNADVFSSCYCKLK